MSLRSFSQENHSSVSVEDLAKEFWSNDIVIQRCDEDLVKYVYSKYVSNCDLEAFQYLDISGYLEKYLFPTLSQDSSFEHVLTMLKLINQKCFDNVPIFSQLVQKEAQFQLFITKVVDIFEHIVHNDIRVAYLRFLTNLFRSLELPLVRRCGLRYLYLPLWDNISEDRLNLELKSYPQLKKTWMQLTSASDEQALKKARTSRFGRESSWIFDIVSHFIIALESCEIFELSSSELKYFEISVEFIVDLLSQLPTRRFFHTLLQDMNLNVRCVGSALFESGGYPVFNNLVKILDDFMNFPFHDHTGKSLSVSEVNGMYVNRIHRLQQVAFSNYLSIARDLVYSGISLLMDEAKLRKHLLVFSADQLADIVVQLGKISSTHINQFKTENFVDDDEDGNESVLFSYLVETLVKFLCPPEPQISVLKRLSLYPTEDILWKDEFVPFSSSVSVYDVYALPKLNLQFLTLYDYFIRNFMLYRYESSYEIREDISDSIQRVCPRQGIRGETVFGGWARMALPISSCAVDEVSSPIIGEQVPRCVKCSVNIDLKSCSGSLRDEWESLKEHDIVFLVTIEKPTVGENDASTSAVDADFPSKFGVSCVRGGEIFEFRDESDVILNDFTRPDERATGRMGSKRKLRLFLDPSQYYTDMKNGRNVYESFNLLVRRDPKENNFKCVLEAIRDLMSLESLDNALPKWFSDLFLGYGKPDAAYYKSLLPKDSAVQFDACDTFLDGMHVIESFRSASKIEFEDINGSISSLNPQNDASNVELPCPPYKISITSEKDGEIVHVKSYVNSSRGPYPFNQPRMNHVRFTTQQIEAIRSAMFPGLSCIVGPPGTGKTDTAVQIISNLYHNYPNQKIVLITHSNAALNDLFEKIMERDIDPRHLLRLGSGERDLRESLAVSGAKGSGRGQGEEFSKQGRVNWALARRLELLQLVQRLALSLGGQFGDVGSSCENAEYFFQEKILPLLALFRARMKDDSNTPISSYFPFHGFFIDAPQPLFHGDSRDVDVAVGCLNHLENIFHELSDYRAFELLRTQGHRSDYLLTKQARIVAMTCTHAAIIRRRLLELDFHYDSLVVEEAAQILDIETFIPLQLQRHSSVDGCRLKRIVLLGDHNQLSPIVQSLSLQKFSKMDQSLFSRLIRMSVPHITLDMQGRARPEIAALYNWKYVGPDGRIFLRDLPLLSMNPHYQAPNPGFLYSFQFIDVADFNGRGEFTPSPYFYQNLGEAEYIVAVYQYMRLLGYPASKISILTTYNGQKHLIRDILSKRCKNNVFGYPAVVSTVDRYQGQQNDYVLLSLVRTSSLGHIRDIRRLIVAMSRSRLGLYIFGRKALFDACYDMSPVMQQLLKHEPVLSLVSGEVWSSEPLSRTPSEESSSSHFSVSDVTAMGVLVYRMTQDRVSLKK